MPYPMGVFQCTVRLHGNCEAVAICDCNYVSGVVIFATHFAPDGQFSARCLMPKLFLVIFVGSQVANLSDGKTRGEMSTEAKVLNVLSIIVSIGIGGGTGA